LQFYAAFSRKWEMDQKDVHSSLTEILSRDVVELKVKFMGISRGELLSFVGLRLSSH